MVRVLYNVHHAHYWTGLDWTVLAYRVWPSFVLMHPCCTTGLKQTGKCPMISFLASFSVQKKSCIDTGIAERRRCVVAVLNHLLPHGSRPQLGIKALHGYVFPMPRPLTFDLGVLLPHLLAKLHPFLARSIVGVSIAVVQMEVGAAPKTAAMTLRETGSFRQPASRHTSGVGFRSTLSSILRHRCANYP